MASLFVVRGRDQGKHFPLSTGANSIGRENGNNVQLLDSESSRNHALIQIDPEGSWQIEDLGSSNGTRVNGQRVTAQKINNGDRIEIGSTLLIFTGTSPPSVIEPAHGVDIVEASAEESQIVSSLSQSNVSLAPPSTSSRRLDTDRSLEVMYLAAIAVGRTDDLNELLQRVLRLVFDWVEADRGCVMLRDQNSGQLTPTARCDSDRLTGSSHESAGPQDASSHHARSSAISISQTILQYVIERQEGVRTSNARDDERFDAAASIVQGGVREALCVPLQGRYGIVGALYVDTYTPPGQLITRKNRQRFTDDHLRFITAIGHQAALAIEDTTYYSALLQSERLAVMGQTIASLSHHIKNILQGIRGGSYLIEAGLKRGDTQAVEKGWGIVDRNQERISNLVMDMLTFSKEREPHKQACDLNRLVSDVLELMQTRAEELGVTIESDLAGDGTPAFCDPDAIHRAVLNLVTNAIDAASGQTEVGESHLEVDPKSTNSQSTTPQVRLQTAFDPEAGWIIDVVDNGPGIAPEDQAKIFSLFESSKGMRGTGLGLPVTAKIMQEHGGEIKIVDRGLDRGTCFRLRLPQDDDSKESSQPPVKSPTSPEPPSDFPTQLGQ